MLYSVLNDIPDYRNLIENVGDIVYRVDNKGKISFVNKAFETLLGYTREYLSEQPVSSILTDESKEFLSEWYKRFLQQKAEDKFLVHFTARDGKIAIIEIKVVPVYEKKKIIGFQGIGRDMTDRIRTEDELKKKTWELEALYTISNIINQSLEIGDALDKCLGEICNFFNTQVAFVRLFDLDKGTTHLIAHRGLSNKYLEAERASPVRLSESVIYQMLKAGKTVIIDDYQKSSFPRRKRLLAEKISSAVFVPMRAREKLWGGVVLGSTHYKAFSTNSIDFLEAMGNQLGMAIENAQHYREILKNISELKIKEDQLKEARDFLANILKNTLDGIIVTDKHGTITFFNPGALNLTDYSPGEMVGHKTWRFYTQGKEEARKIMDILLREGKLANYELELIGRDGRLIPTLLSASLLKDEQGNILGTVGIVKDLTEKRQWENQIFLAEKLASIGKLAAGTAHEILNPIQIILSSVQLLLINKESLDQKLVQRLKTVQDQTYRVAEVINGLLGFASEPTTTKSYVDLNEVVDKTLSLVRHDFSSKGIEVIARLSSSPLIVYANADELSQVFLNLLINANEAMPQGGKMIINSNLTKLRKRSWVRIRITDTGIGIAPENRPHIFDPFFTTKEVGKGTGLGLSVCYGIIKRHGGFIEVESQVGKGSTFTLQLPFSSRNGPR